MWVSEGFILDIIKLSYLFFVFQAIFSCVLNETFISGANVEVGSLPLCDPVPLLLRGAEDSVVSGLVESFPWRWSTRSFMWTRESTIFSLSKERTYHKTWKILPAADWLTNLNCINPAKDNKSQVQIAQFWVYQSQAPKGGLMKICKNNLFTSLRTGSILGSEAKKKTKHKPKKKKSARRASRERYEDSLRAPLAIDKIFSRAKQP